MSRHEAQPIAPMLLTFLAGAAVGAVVMALTTPKTGPQLRRDMRSLANRAKRRAEDIADDLGESWDDLKECAGLAAEEHKPGKPVPAKKVPS
jgi:gas vesicle protein